MQGWVKTKTRGDGALSTRNWGLNEGRLTPRLVTFGQVKVNEAVDEAWHVPPTTLLSAGSIKGTLERTEPLQDMSTQSA